ncbi:hypothetical protein ACHAC9_20645 [Massilia sp. CMS3.1]|uniref:hypothetical protein n=1 Tax=Massilia sp. CMS3.1 TaxID=3373083 RepID=UPI003EE6A1C9
MTINKLVPPDSTSAAATRQLAALERAQGRIPNMEAGGGVLANPENCLPIYHLDGKVLCQMNADGGVPLSAATPVGWQYLIGQDDHAKSVEVVGDKAVAIDTGEVALEIAHALKIADQGHPDEMYEARMLTFGRAENPVLWLHPEDGVDRFYSLGPEPAEVEPALVLDGAMKAAVARQAIQASPNFIPGDEVGG